MRRAGQTPHGARPNREGARLRPGACRPDAPQPPGRSLEPRSNARSRGMAVPQHSCCGQNSAYRSGCHMFLRGFFSSAYGFGRGLPLRSRPHGVSTYRSGCLISGVVAGVPPCCTWGWGMTRYPEWVPHGSSPARYLTSHPCARQTPCRFLPELDFVKRCWS
jgi:hypothetical protein